jgi:hypothetical protein
MSHARRKSTSLAALADLARAQASLADSLRSLHLGGDRRSGPRGTRGSGGRGKRDGRSAAACDPPGDARPARAAVGGGGGRGAGRAADHHSAGGRGGFPATSAAAAASAHAALGGELQPPATPPAFVFAAGRTAPCEGPAKRRRDDAPLPLPPPSFPPLQLAPAPERAAPADGGAAAAGGDGDVRLSPPEEEELPTS